MVVGTCLPVCVAPSPVVLLSYLTEVGLCIDVLKYATMHY